MIYLLRQSSFDLCFFNLINVLFTGSQYDVLVAIIRQLFFSVARFWKAAQSRRGLHNTYWSRLTALPKPKWQGRKSTVITAGCRSYRELENEAKTETQNHANPFLKMRKRLPFFWMKKKIVTWSSNYDDYGDDDDIYRATAIGGRNTGTSHTIEPERSTLVCHTCV